ncbi:MAG: phosphate ABC transporter ATP-binding protein [Gemmatimonadetes bacterium]|nr:phosphate ABC transporter ATP-binding protein [Gemmatimonadota bacterium]
MIHLDDFSVHVGQRAKVQHLTLRIPHATLHAIIGPAGSGKTTLLRALDLLGPHRDDARLSGTARVADTDIVALSAVRWPDPRVVATHRRRVGIVFAVPHPLPGSIFENVAFGARRAGVQGTTLTARVEEALRHARLWEEVHDRLDLPAARLSGGQQQRLCLARALAVQPQVLLLDEPCSGLDPISTAQIEETLRVLAGTMTCVLVTNSLAQARRVSDDTTFLLGGRLVETGPTAQLFTDPQDARTRDYVAGRFG